MSKANIQSCNAIRFVRKVRGGTQASLLETDCGRRHIVKIANNSWGPRILINEVLTSCVLRVLRIETPPVSYVRFTEEFIDGNKDLWLRSPRGLVRPTTGPHFGSEVPSSLKVYDLLPDVLLQRVTNLHSFVGALVVDQWVSNIDARQVVWVRKNEGFQALFIDHEQCFAGERWDYWDSPLQGLYIARAVYRSVRSLGEFDDWLARVRNLPESFFSDTVRSLPAEWVTAAGAVELDRLLTRLLRRRRRLADLVRATYHESGAFCRSSVLSSDSTASNALLQGISD